MYLIFVVWLVWLGNWYWKLSPTPSSSRYHRPSSSDPELSCSVLCWIAAPSISRIFNFRITTIFLPLERGSYVYFCHFHRHGKTRRIASVEAWCDYDPAFYYLFSWCCSSHPKHTWRKENFLTARWCGQFAQHPLPVSERTRYLHPWLTSSSDGRPITTAASCSR